MKNSIITCWLLFLVNTAAHGQSINHISGTLFADDKVKGPQQTLTVNGDAQSTNFFSPFDEPFNANGGSFTLSETGMVNALSGTDRQNRHEFDFGFHDGSTFTATTFDNSVPWTVSFDANITTKFFQPRKSFAFILRGASSNGAAQFNLTSSGPPANGANGGTNTTRGEAAVFGGTVNLNRIVGPCDNGSGSEVCGAFDINGGMEEYTAGVTGGSPGQTVSLSIQHIPSPDDGVTPAKVIYSYDDGTDVFTNVDQDLRNQTSHPGSSFTGEFEDGYTMGLNILGRANRDAPYGEDDYTVALTNFIIAIGDADFDDDNDVDGADVLIWQRGFGTGTDNMSGDADYDGDVDADDLARWEASYGTSTPVALAAGITTVPEPGAGLLLLLGSLGWAARRRSFAERR